MRIGVMGGTFDPPHLGHLIVAEQARCALHLSKVLFIPAGNPVFKKDRNVTPAHDRYAMCQKAIADNPHFEISDIEIARGGDTYTVDTLRELATMYPSDTQLWIIIGSDAFALMDEWYKPDEVAKRAHVAVMARPGFSREQVVKNERLQKFEPTFVSVTKVGISSTDIRWRARHNQTIRYLVPRDVAAYIASHHLYLHAQQP